jgi:hypothetical protein
MNNPVTLILSIIEQPTAKKPYEDLLTYLKKVNREEEAAGVDYLIRKRFDANYHSNSSGE